MQNFINSGILETYVLGCATEAEAKEVLYMSDKHPEVKDALHSLEIDMERIAGAVAVMPPPPVWNKIEKEIDDIVLRERLGPQLFREAPRREQSSRKAVPDYIDIEAESTHMRVHKIWKWVLLAIFVLGKVFLGFAIFYYLENRNIKSQVDELKTELRHLKGIGK